MKLKTPKIKPVHRPVDHVAFGEGERAFRDPQTMTAPDQAFTAAMAQPQKTLPPLPPVPGGER